MSGMSRTNIVNKAFTARPAIFHRKGLKLPQHLLILVSIGRFIGAIRGRTWVGIFVGLWFLSNHMPRPHSNNSIQQNLREPIMNQTSGIVNQNPAEEVLNVVQIKEDSATKERDPEREKPDTNVVQLKEGSVIKQNDPAKEKQDVPGAPDLEEKSNKATNDTKDLPPPPAEDKPKEEPKTEPPPPPPRKSPTLDPEFVAGLEVADQLWGTMLSSNSYCLGEFAPCRKELVYPKMPASFPLNISIGYDVKCRSNPGKSPNVLIMVVSHVEHFNERKEIRRTWGSFAQRLPGVTVVYMTFKAANESFNTKLLKESQEHGDILQADVLETRYNVGYKELSAFDWATKKCPQVTHVLKADEDAYIVVPNLMKFVRNHDAFHGVIFGSPQPFRWVNVEIYDANAKLRAASGLPYDHEVERAYPLNLNPPYALSNYLLTADLLGPLRNAARHGPYWAMDGDVYVSGVLRARIMAPLIERGAFRVAYFPGLLSKEWIFNRLIETRGVVIHRHTPHGSHLPPDELELVHSAVQDFFSQHGQ